MALLRRGAAAYRTTGAQAWVLQITPSSPWSPRAPARSKRAQSFPDEALQIVDTIGERWLAAELNRRKGQLLVQGDADAAEERYGQVLSIGRMGKVA